MKHNFSKLIPVSFALIIALFMFLAESHFAFSDSPSDLKKIESDVEKKKSSSIDSKIGLSIEAQVEDIDFTNEVIYRIHDRFIRAGVKEPSISRVGLGRFIIQLPGFIDIKKTRQLIEGKGVLRFLLVDEELMQMPAYSKNNLQKIYDSEVNEPEENINPEKTAGKAKWTFEEFDEKMHSKDLIPKNVILRIFEDKDMRDRISKIPLLLRSTEDDPEIFRGDDFISSDIKRLIYGGQQATVSFKVRKEAAEKFADITRNYCSNSHRAIPVSIDEKRGWRIAIVLDDKVLSAPAIQSEISGGSGVITGFGSIAKADDLVIKLKSGSLPCKTAIIRINIEYLEDLSLYPRQQKTEEKKEGKKRPVLDLVEETELKLALCGGPPAFFLNPPAREMDLPEDPIATVLDCIKVLKKAELSEPNLNRIKFDLALAYYRLGNADEGRLWAEKTWHQNLMMKRRFHCFHLYIME